MLVQNRLLAGMAPETFDHLRPWLQPIALKRRAILQEYDCRIEHIYFIERGLVSVFARTKRDGPVEVSIVGRFGFVGVAAVLGIMRSPIRCWMEVPGEALRITSKDLRRVMDAIPAVRQHLLNYVHALLIQNSLLALCNVRHELEERLCRWLLLASDRLDAKAIPLTHDQLSISLGVRRASVTTTLANLEEAGAVIKSRRAIEIASRAILEKKTCECYRIIASEYARISGSGRHIIEAVPLAGHLSHLVALMFCAGAAFGQITVGDDDPNRMDNATWEAQAIEPPEKRGFAPGRSP